MNAYNVDFAKMTITITADFAKRMNNPNSEEYKTICRFRKDFPAMRIVNRTHRTPSKYVSKKTGQKSKCNPYKKLTYKNMESFINGLPDAEQYLKSYNFLKDCGGLTAPSHYAIIRRWFVDQFPKYYENPIFYLYNKVAVIDCSSYLKTTQEKDAEAESKEQTSAEEPKKIA